MPGALLFIAQVFTQFQAHKKMKKSYAVLPWLYVQGTGAIMFLLKKPNHPKIIFPISRI